MTKLQNSKCDQTQKPQFGTKFKTQIVTKLKNSNCDETKNSHCDKTLKLKLGQN